MYRNNIHKNLMNQSKEINDDTAGDDEYIRDLV